MKTAACLGLLASCAFAAAQFVPTPLYAPARSIKDQKISLEGWGSGSIAETDGIAYQGTKSVRVSSRNFFQGGSMFLGNPVDVAKKFDDKSNLLTLTFFLEDAGWVYGVDDKGDATRGNDNGKRTGGAFQTSAGVSSKITSSGAPPPFKPKIKAIRMIITTTDDKKSEIYVPVGTSQTNSDARGWRNLSIPLQAINGLDRTNKIIKEISFSADTFSVMYVGALQVTTDQTPIEGQINAQDMNLALGDTVTITATGDGGSSVLVYDWDFDAADGIQVDAEGSSVSHKFRTAGKFKVTLTISDLYGLKKPFTKSFTVTVNP